MPLKRHRGAALLEAALVFLPFFALTLGGVEFMWHFHVRQCLTAAADAAVRQVSPYHGEEGIPDMGVSSQSLAPLIPAAQAAATTLLSEMGFSDDFIASVTIDVDYIQHLPQVKARLNNVGGFPQKEKMRLIGAVVSIPWLEAMVFGNFAMKVFNISMEQPTNLIVITFNWKQWKVNS